MPTWAYIYEKLIINQFFFFNGEVGTAFAGIHLLNVLKCLKSIPGHEDCAWALKSLKYNMIDLFSIFGYYTYCKCHTSICVILKFWWLYCNS